MKHPFRWVVLAVGAGVCVLAVVLALTVSTDPQAEANTSRLVGKPRAGVLGRGPRRRADHARRAWPARPSS